MDVTSHIALLRCLVPARDGEPRFEGGQADLASSWERLRHEQGDGSTGDCLGHLTNDLLHPQNHRFQVTWESRKPLSAKDEAQGEHLSDCTFQREPAGIFVCIIQHLSGSRDVCRWSRNQDLNNRRDEGPLRNLSLLSCLPLGLGIC